MKNGLGSNQSDLLEFLESKNQSEYDYDFRKERFWVHATLYILIGLIAALGNGFVLFVTYGYRNSGRLRYLDNAIKSLALTDMLFGLIGMPCRTVVDYNIGK